MSFADSSKPSHAPLFPSFFLAGFECASHRRADGRRLDLSASTGHDRNVEADYLFARACGFDASRDGFRWHLIERTPGHYDWSSALTMIRAARKTGIHVIWDLMHYGYPDHLDIWRPEFVAAFARYAASLVRLMVSEGESAPFVCPVNEISFWSWCGGDVGAINPCTRGRGFELKAQLCRAAIAAIEAILEVAPQARIVHAEPAINVIGNPILSGSVEGHAEDYRQAQYQAWDIIAGRVWPQLGGRPEFLDIIGINYYPRNQWIDGAGPVDRWHPAHKPFSRIIAEIWERYQRPVFIAETGCEDEMRPTWLTYIAGEVRRALAMNIPVEGICLYPIINHPGWDDDRPCACGLFSNSIDSDGRREIYAPLGAELRRQQEIIDVMNDNKHR